MRRKQGPAFELIVIPAMLAVPLLFMVRSQKRLVAAPDPTPAHAPAAPGSGLMTLNGFPYLLLENSDLQSTRAASTFARLSAESEARLGRDHPETLIRRNNLANALLAEGKYLEAEKLQRTLLADMMRVLPEHHPDTFRCRFNLALNLRMQGNTTAALSEMEAVYAGWREVLGEGHPRTQAALLVLENLRAPH